MNLRLLIADDHTLVRTGIREVLLRLLPGAEVFDAPDGFETLTLAARVRPDVVLMDISMPGMNGIETTRRLKHDLPDCRVIMLSMHRDEDRVVQAIRAGADGYLLKDDAIGEVTAAIQSVCRGDVFISPRVPQGVHTMLADGAPAGGPLAVLTGRQREILQLIAEGSSTKEIGFMLNVSGKTVDTHRRLLMERLGIFDVAGLARFAIRTGLVTADR